MSKRSNPTKIDHFKSVFEERSGVQNFSLRHFSFSLGFSLALPPTEEKNIRWVFLMDLQLTNKDLTSSNKIGTLGSLESLLRFFLERSIILRQKTLWWNQSLKIQVFPCQYFSISFSKKPHERDQQEIKIIKDAGSTQNLFWICTVLVWWGFFSSLIRFVKRKLGFN